MPSPFSSLMGDGLLPSIVTHNWYISTLGFIILAVIGLGVYRLTLHPLAQFPGPLEARISDIWRNSRYWRGTWHEDILEVHKRYGSVVRIAPNELSVVDAEATRKLYNHGTKALKTDWYHTWSSGSAPPTVFPITDKKLHSFLRKRISSAYSMSAMLRYEVYMQECLDFMMEKLKAKAELGEIVDMSKWTNNLAFDIVGTLAYGAPLGMLETDSDVMNLQSLIHQGFFLMCNMGHYWGQMSILTHPVSKKIQNALGLRNPFGPFESWTRQRVVARRQGESKSEREDMMTHFLAMKTAEGAPVEDSAVISEALNIVGAGADTTSIGMRSCLYYLCKHPNVYRQVQREIDQYYTSKQLDRPITYQQTLELPLLCASIREATRLLPSITYQLLRYAPEDLVVDGKLIPQGTSIGISPIAANRDKKVWGDDANEFSPSRWLGDEHRVRLFNTHDMTFGGSGPRMCIGRNVALVEMHKFLAQLLHRFDVDFVDAEKPWVVKSQWFAHQSDMHMKLRYRGGLKTEG